MEFVDDVIMQNALAAMPEEFDSDQWIAEIRRIAEKPYIQELHKKAQTTDLPIQQTHADMASRLRYSPFDEQVEKIEDDRPATSIKGTPTTVARWRKKKVQT